METEQLEKTSAKKPTRKQVKNEKKNQRKSGKSSEVKQSTATTRKAQKKKQKEERKNKIPRSRIFPIWLRMIVILLLAVSALVAGLMIGYGVIGDGNPTDVLKKETWQHIIDLVIKDK